MNDKQLLELAAHAAGYKVSCLPISASPGYSYGFTSLNDSGAWNPSNDDADAFRLMVDLNLNVFCMNGKAYAMDLEADHEQQVEIGNDKYAAMRRAILQCAASIGKQMGI